MARVKIPLTPIGNADANFSVLKNILLLNLGANEIEEIDSYPLRIGRRKKIYRIESLKVDVGC